MQCDQQDFQRPLRCLQGWIRRGAQTNVYHWSVPGRRNLYNIVLFDPNDRGWNNFLGKVLRRFLAAGRRRRCGYWLPGHDQLPRLGVTPHQEDRGHRAASIRGQRLADWNWLCCGGLRSQWESKFSLEKKPTKNCAGENVFNGPLVIVHKNPPSLEKQKADCNCIVSNLHLVQ